MVVKGALIRLRRPREEDVDYVVEWVQNDDFQLFLAGEPLVSRQKLKEFLLPQVSSTFSGYDSVMNFIVETKKRREPIGFIRFHSISWKNRNGMLEVFIAEENQNLPYGPDTILTIADFAFNELNFHKITAIIFEYNKRSIHVAERSGAKREVVLRKHVYRKGKYHDVYGYGIFKSDYEKLVEELKGTFLERS